MSYRVIGAVLIVSGCGGFGISMMLSEKHHEKLLECLLQALQYMKWELQFRLSPLPQLLLGAGKQAGGETGVVLMEVSRELSGQLLPDAGSCVNKVLAAHQELPRDLRCLLRKLGTSLGTYDLPGQLEGLTAVETACSGCLEKLETDKALRFRNYRTLGFCAGAALVILFI